MAIKVVDLLGLKPPQLLLEMTFKVSSLQPGDTLEVTTDCDTFEEDVGRWSKINNKNVQWIKDIGNGVKQCQILA